ncbi:MAG: hypothetical protein ACI808_002895 [Paraglaciecola sp.]|jgi:hypothetical protein
MTLFEFLMIMQSIIIGLGISELLTGLAKLLRTYRLKELGIILPALILTIFLALLQMFWETWGLRSETEWTFPAMMLMLGGPVILHLIAHIMFPLASEKVNITKYYLSKSNLIWSLAIITVFISTLFKPLAFGEPIFIVDNLSSLLTLLFCLLLIMSKNIWLHRSLVPLGVVVVAWDVLAITYQIQ